MHLPILQDDESHNDGLCCFQERSNGRQAGRQARQRAFMSTLCVEDVTARLMSEHVPVSIFYECKKKKNLQQKLRMYSFSPQNYEPVSESYF